MDQTAAPAGEGAPKDLEEGEILQSVGDEKAAAPQKEEKDMTPAERKAARIAAKRAVLLAAEEELKVSSLGSRQNTFWCLHCGQKGGAHIGFDEVGSGVSAHAPVTLGSSCSLLKRIPVQIGGHRE